MAQAIQDQGQGNFGQGGQNQGGGQSFGQQGGGQGDQQLQIPVRLMLDVDELECLVKTITDAQQQLSSAEDTPDWMRSKYLPRLQSIRQAIVTQVNQQFRPGTSNPAVQQVSRALEHV